MLNLRLAEYNLETGKFERFLELGKNFGTFKYRGSIIEINNYETFQITECRKDPKDPLRRFDGLLNDRTYGEGKFVLIRNIDSKNPDIWEDDVVEGATAGMIGKSTFWNGKEIILVKWDKELTGFAPLNIYEEGDFYNDSTKMKSMGNLHENPELYEKLKK